MSTVLLPLRYGRPVLFQKPGRHLLDRSNFARTNLRSNVSHTLSSAVFSTNRVRPLEGLTVVTLEQAIAAPFCTRQLAELGARVIKVERPEVGDFARSLDTRVRGLASHFVWTNRSKESLALDLKKNEDHDILKRLLARADVLVQNLAPGACERLGLSYQHLSTKHPSLIVCNISGYGQDGPYREKKAYDLLVQSEAGVLSVTGTPTESVKVGIPVADIAAGMYAYSNILAAIMARNRSTDGHGCNIDVSMLESVVEWMGFPLYYAFDDAPGPKANGASHAAIYPYGPFPTGRDANAVMLGIQNEREFAKFCELILENPELATDSRFQNNSLRVKNQHELQPIIHEAFSKLTAEEVLKKLDAVGIANAHVNDMKGLWNHPQLAARRRWIEIDSPVGMLPALIPPGIAPEHASQSGLGHDVGPIPEIGQHNAKILSELGREDLT